MKESFRSQIPKSRRQICDSIAKLFSDPQWLTKVISQNFKSDRFLRSSSKKCNQMTASKDSTHKHLALKEEEESP